MKKEKCAMHKAAFILAAIFVLFIASCQSDLDGGVKKEVQKEFHPEVKYLLSKSPVSKHDMYAGEVISFYKVKRRCKLKEALHSVGFNLINFNRINSKNLLVPLGCQDGEEVEVRLSERLKSKKNHRERFIRYATVASQPSDWTTLLPLIEHYNRIIISAVIGEGSVYKESDGRVSKLAVYTNMHMGCGLFPGRSRGIALPGSVYCISFEEIP